MKNTELKHILIAYKSTNIGLQQAHDEILRLFSVVGQSEQLPTKDEFIFELNQHQEKYKTAHTDNVNNAYALGFRHCFNFINDRVKIK